MLIYFNFPSVPKKTTAFYPISKKTTAFYPIINPPTSSFGALVQGNLEGDIAEGHNVLKARGCSSTFTRNQEAIHLMLQCSIVGIPWCHATRQEEDLTGKTAGGVIKNEESPSTHSHLMSTTIKVNATLPSGQHCHSRLVTQLHCRLLPLHNQRRSIDEHLQLA